MSRNYAFQVGYYSLSRSGGQAMKKKLPEHLSFYNPYSLEAMLFSSLRIQNFGYHPTAWDFYIDLWISPDTCPERKFGLILKPLFGHKGKWETASLGSPNNPIKVF